ncbi:MAG: ribonuclease HII [Muribaculaceae bacterium]|nr:ribonuclease HII [Muribaculaceae bacterium]
MQEGLIEAGCDEAGRGCLCGPVACAAVILPPDFKCKGLNDSKQLSEKAREELRPIIEDEALAWSVVMVSPDEIDRVNILRASILGMQRALDDLKWQRIFPSPYVNQQELTGGMPAIPEHILVDGNRFSPYRNIPYTTVVHGDAIYASIAAASILAKTYRDALMRRLAREYPGYGWERNMGYPTREHKEAIARLGLTPHHRRSYKPCSLQGLVKSDQR